MMPILPIKSRSFPDLSIRSAHSAQRNKSADQIVSSLPKPNSATALLSTASITYPSTQEKSTTSKALPLIAGTYHAINQTTTNLSSANENPTVSIIDTSTGAISKKTRQRTTPLFISQSKREIINRIRKEKEEEKYKIALILDKINEINQRIKSKRELFHILDIKLNIYSQKNTITLNWLSNSPSQKTLDLQWASFISEYIDEIITTLNQLKDNLNYLRDLGSLSEIDEIKDKLSFTYKDVAESYLGIVNLIPYTIEITFGKFKLQDALQETLIHLQSSSHEIIQEKVRDLARVKNVLGDYQQLLSISEVAYQALQQSEIDRQQLKKFPIYLNEPHTKKLLNRMRIKDELKPEFKLSQQHSTILSAVARMQLEWQGFRNKQALNTVDLINDSIETGAIYHSASDRIFTFTLLEYESDLPLLRTAPQSHYENKIQTLRLITSHREDIFQTLNELAKQYQKSELAYRYAALQCRQQSWIDACKTLDTLSNLIQHRVKVIENVLQQFLMEQQIQRIPDQGILEQSEFIVFQSEDGILRTGKKRNDSEDIIDDVIEPGIQYCRIKHTQWKQQRIEQLDTIDQELAKLSITAKSKDIEQSIEKLNNQLDKLIQDAQSFSEKKIATQELMQFAKNQSCYSPESVEGCAISRAYRFIEQAGKIEKKLTQLSRLMKQLPSDRENSIHTIHIESVHLLITQLLKTATELTYEGKMARIKMIQQRNDPKVADLRYLMNAFNDGIICGFKIQKTKNREELKMASENHVDNNHYLDEYKITLGENVPNHWYAHFHYTNKNIPLDQYIAGHLKNEAERLIGKNWEQRQRAQGFYTKIYRAKIDLHTAKNLFFLK